jgi:hypothetical protein
MNNINGIEKNIILPVKNWSMTIDKSGSLYFPQDNVFFGKALSRINLMKLRLNVLDTKKQKTNIPINNIINKKSVCDSENGIFSL